MKKKEVPDRIIEIDEEIVMQHRQKMREIDVLIETLRKLPLEDIENLRSALWLVGGKDIYSPDYRPDRPNFDNKYYFYKADGEFKKVEIDTILYVEAKDNYVYLHFSSGKPIMIRSTLEGIWRELPIHDFYRINRTHCVAVKHITAFNKEYVKLGELQFSFSKTYHHLLEDRFESLGGYATN